MRKLALCAIVLSTALCATAQQAATSSAEKSVPLTEKAIAFDAKGASALEATLNTTVLNGSSDTPVTNIRVVVKNSSAISYALVSGLATFYDGAGVRCGDQLTSSSCPWSNPNSVLFRSECCHQLHYQCRR